MDYNLTDKQKAVITWLVEAKRKGELDDEFSIAWYTGEGNYYADIAMVRGLRSNPRLLEGCLTL